MTNLQRFALSRVLGVFLRFSEKSLLYENLPFDSVQGVSWLSEVEDGGSFVC